MDETRPVRYLLGRLVLGERTTTMILQVSMPAEGRWHATVRKDGRVLYPPKAQTSDGTIIKAGDELRAVGRADN